MRGADPEREHAVVLSASRRHVLLALQRHTIVTGTLAARTLRVVVGDEVEAIFDHGEHLVTHQSLRRSTLHRSYRGETQDLAANIDRLFIVTAAPPLLNTLSIDRMTVVAHSEGIPCTIVLNKIDVDPEYVDKLKHTYNAAGLEVLTTAAKMGTGLDEVHLALEDSSLQTVALCGVSGVGKSTLLNALIPDASRNTGEVSERTGQGKQTTTQAIGFLYPRKEEKGLVVIDLPGIQNFGVGHLTRDQVAHAFPEVVALSAECEFSSCGHLTERSCAVRDAAEGGTLSASRYDSYCYMCEEIKKAQPY